MTDDPSPDAARDERHLQALRAARAACDEFAARKAMADLLDPYRQSVRTIAYGRLEGVADRAGEATRVAQDVMVRLLAALNKRLHFSVPFHVVVAANLRYAIADFWRENHGEKATAHDPSELPDLAGAVEDPSSAVQQARVFDPYLIGLTERERALIVERIFLDMSPDQSAGKARHKAQRGRPGLSPGAGEAAREPTAPRCKRSREGSGLDLMENFDFDCQDERALRHLDDVALEEGRVQMVADNDSRLDIVIRELVLRATRAIESVCRQRGIDRGLSRDQILKSIDDASVRLLLRLKRPDRQAAVTAVAAEIAASCVDAQEAEAPTTPRLAARPPELRFASEIGDALKRGHLRHNNWRKS